MTVKIIGPIDMRDDVSAAIEDMQRHMEKDLEILFDFETDFLIRLILEDDTSLMNQIEKMASHHAFSIISNMKALVTLIDLHKDEEKIKGIEEMPYNIMKMIKELEWIDLKGIDERETKYEREVHYQD